MNKPPAPPPAMAAYSGVLKRTFIPNSAGSVIPHTAVMPLENASCLMSLFLVLIPTASAAPPWAIFEGKFPGPIMASYPSVMILLAPIGIIP